MLRGSDQDPDGLRAPAGVPGLLCAGLLVCASGLRGAPLPPAAPVPGSTPSDVERVEGGESEAVFFVARNTPGWLYRLVLVAPAGAVEPGDGEAPPTFSRGAPLELRIDLAPHVSDGTLRVAWQDQEGETLGEQEVRLREPVTGEGPRLRLPVPEGVAGEPGAYRVAIRWVPKQPRLLPEGEIAFGVAEAPQAALPGDGEPPGFPWPPPRPTTRHVIEGARLGGGQAPETLGAAADRLIAALAEAGYAEGAFFALRLSRDRPPEGFALVTRLEQIFPDGRPRPPGERWRVDLPAPEVFSLEDLIEALFTAPEGHYRVIVFAVTGRPVGTSEEEPTREEAGDWLGRGLARLPPSLAERPWTPDHACTALIYQFRQVGAGNEAEVNPPGAPPARLQLRRTGILAALGGG